MNRATPNPEGRDVADLSLPPQRFGSSVRLFVHILSLEARKSMSYRVDFWINAAAGVVVGIVIPYCLWKAVFAATGRETIAGFEFESLLFYYVVVTLVAKVVQGPNYRQLVSTDIYEGELNKYLVYPTSYFAFKLAQQLGSTLPVLVQLVVFGLGFTLVLDLPADALLGPSTLAASALSVLAAHLLFFALVTPLQLIAFWADNVWSLSVTLHLVSALFGGLMVPVRLFPEWAQELLLWTPFPYLFAYPVEMLLGRMSWAEWGSGFAVVAVWLTIAGAISCAIWRRGQLRYSGVGI